MSKIKYPILGYAPGTYQCKCTSCGTVFTGDKLAVQCEPCAINALNEGIASAYNSIAQYCERIAELEKEVGRLKELLEKEYKTMGKIYFEKYGFPDSLAREKSEQCWGVFKKENNL